ncbi:MAG: thiosulfate oxidation carrier protein SoxY [Reyranella sp.]|uniref:thiosulfate oxidation carrier protein SoxY n=1 Tax=Reyranella sp. TaxID=1929291 RepID=UPI001ACF9496|nr:thiosulfate oxidation carrier protein SoxY [Reyranella sp.]MBN9086063.1 thiosulfate oxidation carrier protein SoxY [Reyranella sp.]
MIASRVTRRTALAAPLMALAGTLVARNAFATADQAKDWLAALAKGAPKDGKVTLKAPEIAENGNAVPLTVSVDSPMNDTSYVKAIYIAADGNPNPGVSVFEFTPLSGKAEIALRVRLQQTQKLVAVAEMNDGALFTASREIKVTIGGCGG